MSFLLVQTFHKYDKKYFVMMQKSNYVKIFSSIISEDFKTTSFRIIVHNVWLQMCIFTSSLHTKTKQNVTH